MASRQSYAPMDFEYDNKEGPIPADSPWKNVPPAKKRTHSVLDSPSKSAFSTPNRLQLNAPAGQSYFFPQSQKPIPSIPSHVQSSKWEPRTPHSEVDFSSGGETPNTPAQDSDAATPDTQLANRMGSLSHGLDKKSPRKSRRQSLMQFFTGSPTPAKDDSRKPYSRKAENRIMKRRSKKTKATLGGEYDSSEEQSPAKELAPPPPPGFVASIPGVLSWVEAHPNLPAVLSYYMQFVVNAALGVLFLWIVYSAYCAVMNDIDREAASAARQILHDIAVCTHEYNQNHCGKTRVPALEQPCNQWQLCMQQDAYQIARASVGARTFAMIFNAFVEEFSYKAMAFTAIILFGGFNLSNYAFGRFRDRQSYSQHHEYYPPPPATPQRQPSNGYMDQNGWHTPYGTPYGSVNQHMLQAASKSLPALPSTAEEMEASPSKKGLFRR